MITIRGRPIAVDIRAELERFDFVRPRWTHDKLIAASPFRYDTHPSWFVNLDEDSEYYGCWSDSGAVDDEWRSGGFVKLLAFLRGETYEEAADYLLAEYAALDDGPAAEITLKVPQLMAEPQRLKVTLDERILDAYQFRHPYLGGRGIDEAVQRLLGVGYDRRRNAITLPWRHPDGKLAALKYRSTYSRVFWYEKGGAPIRDLVYGIDVIYSRRIKRAAIVEGEVDAMTLMTAGMPAIATGGATNWTRIKRDIIVRSPLEDIVIYRDNDAAGKAWARRIMADLSPYMSVRLAYVPGRFKDVNDAHNGGWVPRANIRQISANIVGKYN
ncbi:toprim domain-containing protein [Paenibacillus naphthalenovorans]|uniref:toprim domain-containing protein n=1 Tax=Paenibacillus naphthalenovorans TaxID=162209 RepID=UPI003D299805